MNITINVPYKSANPGPRIQATAAIEQQRWQGADVWVVLVNRGSGWHRRGVYRTKEAAQDKLMVVAGDYLGYGSKP